MPPVLAAVTAFAVTAVLLAVGTSQLDRSWTPGRPSDPLVPGSLPDLPALDTHSVVDTSLQAAGANRTVNGRLQSPVDGADAAVVLVAGAGPSSQEDFLDHARQLARRGVHAATYDKTTEGYSWFSRDFAALAADLQAVVAEIRQVTGARRVGVLAYSEGGWVAARLAASPSDLDFLVLASAPLVSPLEQALWNVDSRLAAMPDGVRRVAATAVAGGRSFLGYLDEDPLHHLRASQLPILGIWGAEDRIVPVPAAVRRLVEHTPHPVTAMVLPGTGHDLGGPAGWLDYVAGWVLAERPPATDEVTGTQPAATLDVPKVPQRSWFTDPAGHLAVSTLVAATVLILTGRRSGFESAGGRPPEPPDSAFERNPDHVQR